MASLRPTASLALSVRADTTRALNEFKRFSAQLDNKFLVSGLKLDVVRSALSQINREFQRAIGEQGVQAGQSLRSAQNQAATILDTFKNVGTESALSITEQFSSAFSEIAITAGGSAKDIQKALSATGFISTNLPEDIRRSLGKGILEFQRDARRAGLGDTYAELIQQFLAGQVTARDLIETGRPLESRVGAELGRLGGTVDEIVSPEQRSRIVQQLQNSSGLRETLQRLIARADWGFTIIEDLNARLFNPERGVFGVLREITMSVGDKSTLFMETRSLIESVFGKQGLFVTFFQQIGKIFAIEDPLRVVIIGIRWITRQFNRLNEFLQSPPVQAIVSLAQKTIKGIVDFFTNFYDGVKSFIEGDQARQISENFTSFFSSLSSRTEEFLNSNVADDIGRYVKEAVDNVTGLFASILGTVEAGDWRPERIQDSIRKIGTDIRSFIRSIGEGFRNLDTSQQTDFILGLLRTLFDEIGRTIGAVISEGLKTLIPQVIPAIFGAGGVVNKGLTGLFSEIFGEGAGAVLGGAATLGIVAAFGKKITFGLLGLADSVVKALPGGQRLQQYLGNQFARRNPRLARFLGIRRTRDLDINAEVLGTDGARSTSLGSAQTFQRQVIYYLSRITGCVCTPGGTEIERSQASRNRYGASSLGYSGPQRNRQYQSPIGPLPDVRQSFRRARIESARNILGRGSSSQALETYLESLRGYDESLVERGRATYEPQGQRLADRYNRRFGRRARMGRMVRGLGRGALITGGIAALGAGAIGLFGGGSARASEIDPLTGEPIVSSQQNQLNAAGSIFSGGLEGAMLGATIGSIVPGIGTAAGAVIGGVIGGIVPLMDEGVRKGVRDFASGIGKTFQDGTKKISDFLSSGIESIKDGFGFISKAFSGIDWRRVLINAFIPGGELTIRGIQGLADLASKFNVFDAISNGIGFIRDRMKDVVSLIQRIPGVGQLIPRETGGPGIRGVSYLIGERGPELFTPGANGMVSPTRDLMTLSSGPSRGSSVSANFTIAINVNGGMAIDDVEKLRAPVIAIINEAWQNATVGTASRGSVV